MGMVVAVVEVAVRAGDRVEPGQTLVVLDAMKMEHPLKAAVAGVVHSARILSSSNSCCAHPTVHAALHASAAGIKGGGNSADIY